MKIQSAQGDKKNFSVGFPCHLVDFCAGKGAKELSVNVEYFVIDIYYNFSRSEKLKSS